MTTTTALDARWAAVRAGLSRGWIETRQNLTETAYVIGHAIPPVAYVAVLLFLRGKTVPGTDFALGTMVLPSLLGMTIVYGGLSAPAPSITADREDGTLLRAKATPEWDAWLPHRQDRDVRFDDAPQPHCDRHSRHHDRGRPDPRRPGVAAARTALRRRDGVHRAHRRCTRLSHEVVYAGRAGAPGVHADHARIGHLLSDHRPADVAAVGGTGLPVLLGGAGRTLRDAPRGNGRSRDRPVVAHSSRCSPCSACGQ